MEELKIHGQYEKEDGKRIMRLINEIKVRGIRLAKIVDEGDMTIIANIIATRLLQYAAEKQIERSEKEVGEIEDRFLHGMMLVERDNMLTVEEILGTAEVEDADFDRITIQNKDGVLMYYGDRSTCIPEKLKNACVDHADLNGDWEYVITLASDK